MNFEVILEVYYIYVRHTKIQRWFYITLIENVFKILSTYISSETNLIFTQENGRAKTLHSKYINI